ncbi:hypothetical protein F9K33_08905 [bacterium]|nr:MAG: hypothetical protein F9K33_08905 [bacterium]
MKINFLTALSIALFQFLFISCARISYLDNHLPSDLIFQKKVYGGVTTLVGTELSAPSFSLYADGTVIYYRYMDGKRKFVSSRLPKRDFFIIYNWIENNLSLVTGQTSKLDGAVVSEFYFNSRTVTIEGLGFIQGPSQLDSLHEFSKQIDQLNFKKSKRYYAGQIVLYVKRLSGGEIESWPKWKIPEVGLDSIYQKDISFYEPNVKENSIVLEGKIAVKVQKVVEQTSIYQKFSHKGWIYAVGYKPVVP